MSLICLPESPTQNAHYSSISSMQEDSDSTSKWSSRKSTSLSTPKSSSSNFPSPSKSTDLKESPFPFRPLLSNPTVQSNNSTDIILQSRSDDYSEMSNSRRIVTFHPSIVTSVYERPSTPTEEKSNLYFSRQELQQYRDEEKSQTFEKNKLISVIKSQEKYQKKGKGFQQGSVTKVTFNVSFSHIQ